MTSRIAVLGGRLAAIGVLLLGLTSLGPVAGVRAEPIFAPSGPPEEVGHGDDAARWCRDRVRPQLRAAGRLGRATSAPRPNVIVVMTDDQRWDSLEYMPAVMDRLVDEGIHFDNSFVSTPLCGPSRAAFLTGQYGRNNGVRGNTVLLFDPRTTLATRLQAAGYTTAIIGKYINEYWRIAPTVHPGWDRWQVFERPAYYDYAIVDDGDREAYGGEPAEYSTDVIREHALAFIEENAEGPFFLYFNPFAPHAVAHAAPRHEGRYASFGPWRPASVLEEDIRDKYLWVHWLRHLMRTAPGRSEEEFLARHDREYVAMLESLLAVDDAVAQILDALSRLGIEDETLIVFTSDNGFMWGEHYFRFKITAHEESVRVPLVVRYPPLTNRGGSRHAARNDRRLVMNIDLAPTIAELAGTSLPDVDGQSLAGLLCNSRDLSWRRAMLFENLQPIGFDLLPSYYAIRTQGWKYVHYESTAARYLGLTFQELYDLESDPLELDNLIMTASDDDRTWTVTQTLHRRMLRLLGD